VSVPKAAQNPTLRRWYVHEGAATVERVSDRERKVWKDGKLLGTLRRVGVVRGYWEVNGGEFTNSAIGACVGFLLRQLAQREAHHVATREIASQAEIAEQMGNPDALFDRDDS
jgi:hypothetical protein